MHGKVWSTLQNFKKQLDVWGYATTKKNFETSVFEIEFSNRFGRKKVAGMGYYYCYNCYIANLSTTAE